MQSIMGSSSTQLNRPHTFTRRYNFPDTLCYYIIVFDCAVVCLYHATLFERWCKERLIGIQD